MAVKQKHIAEKLNVSVATVSRCLRGQSYIHPATRNKVLKLASEMGYHRPQESSRRRNGAAKEKLVTFGVMICESEDISRNLTSPAYYILSGISAAAEKMNASLSTHFVSPERCRQIVDRRHHFPAMRAGRLSGLMLIYDWPSEVVRDLSKLFPCVTFLQPSHLDLGVDCVGDDQAEGISMTVEHLYRLGHRRIGFLAGTGHASWMFPRFTGYMQAIERLGLPRDTSLVINVFGSDLDCEAQADVVVENLKRGVTAWVCDDDNIGYNLYRQLVARGLRVPQDVSIAGFNDLVPPQQDCMTLTNVHRPFQQMGIAALQRLLERIKCPEEKARHIQFACELVEGETTGPPAGKQVTV